MHVDTVCYSLERYFARYLPLKRCPDCEGPLDIREVDHSVLGHAFRARAVYPRVETHLARCSKCDWWAVREFRDDVEFMSMFEDDLVMPRPTETPDVVRERSPQLAPWEDVLADGSYWSDRTTPTVHVATRIFGPDAVGARGLGLFGGLGKIVAMLLRQATRA